MTKFAYGAAAIIAVASFGIASQAMAAYVPFTSADADANHYVSYAEAFGIYPTLSQHLFNQADENKDGKLDQGEWTELEGLSAVLTGVQG